MLLPTRLISEDLKELNNLSFLTFLKNNGFDPLLVKSEKEAKEFNFDDNTTKLF